MGGFTRTEMERFWQRWLAANREAERRRDWKPLADHYAEDATYGWMYSPDEHFMAVGREEIRQYALGTEMAGLDGWHYDYVATVMDESNGMVIGFWKQRAGITDDHGRDSRKLSTIAKRSDTVAASISRSCNSVPARPQMSTTLL